ncbi:MAG: RICIN domain-containing protein [Propionibacteriaceae bacterium]
MTHTLTAGISGQSRKMTARICAVLLAAAAVFATLTITQPQTASAAPGPFYYIVAVHSGKPIMPINHTKDYGAEIVQADWQNGGALHWKIRTSGTIDGQQRIRRFENRHSKYCVSSYGAMSPSALTQRSCLVDYTWDEEWVVSSASDMWAGRPFTVWNHHSGLCMDVVGASTAAYTRVGQYWCHGGPNQQFRLVYVQGT